MGIKERLQVFLVGMAIFSMFFGGGNLTFPLWIGIESSSTAYSSIGFILSGVLLPFYGIIIALRFNGNHEEYLSVWGKKVGSLLIFALLLFWIPLGSGPRCNLLAYGAFSCQTGLDIPLWVYSALYSAVVYLLTFRKNQILGILGNVITPVLIFALFFLIFSIVQNDIQWSASPSSNWSDFYSSFLAGYNTMDFIAAIFFASAVISLIKEKQKDTFSIKFVFNACIIAIVLLSVIYIGMITVGQVHAEILSKVSRDQLLAHVGRAMFDEKFQILIFVIITLSVLSTSMALCLVFSDYLRKTIFKEKLDHKTCLFISVFISFLMSLIGFESLATLISYATGALYPFLLVITTVAFAKSYLKQRVKDTLTQAALQDVQ